MDAISPAIGRSVTVTPGGVQTVTDIPAVNLPYPVALATINVVGATNYYNAPPGTWARFNVGDVITVAGCGVPANNGRKRVTAITVASGPAKHRLYVSDTALADEAAGAAMTFTRLLLPRAVQVIATSMVPKMNFWQCDGGAPPASTTAFFVGTTPLLLDSTGYSTFVIDGASGSMTLTPIENP